MSEQVDHRVAAYMAAIAAALEAVPECKTSYGEFYVSEAVISFDGYETGYAIVADEHGGYAVQTGREPTPTTYEAAAVAETRQA